jgi:hypothetical protein
LSIFREPLRQRRGSIELAPVLPTSPAWRIATPKEAKASGLDLGSKVKNRIGFTTPVYTTDGNSALVIGYFLWSIHSAQRTYVLSRQSGSWRLSCTDSVYFV